MDNEDIEIIKRLESDFTFRAKHTLKIRSASGKIEPFIFNDAQIYIQERLEKQKEEVGYVRALILKGRQQGCSTFVGARFFDQVMRESGLKAFILAHREDATINLFGLADRYFENYPPYLKPKDPETGSVNPKESNAKRLTFWNNSGYGVGTSGGGSVGRSDTIQRLHMSECAFYDNTEELKSGILQTVPDLPNTEIIIESTANGIGNMFHEMCLEAQAGKNGYQLIFIPWFWEKRYATKLPENFLLTSEELFYKKLHNVTDEQMMWRRAKISLIGIAKFKQEYPATVTEAFEASIESNFFNIEDVKEAMETKPIQDNSRCILGVDIGGAGKDGDRTVLFVRQGRNEVYKKSFTGLDTTQIVSEIVSVMREFKPIVTFIDKGYNPGVFDGLIALGWNSGGKTKVIGVNFGGSANDPSKYKNKRAEMYARTKQWIEDKPCHLKFDPQLLKELSVIEKKDKEDIHGRLILASKDEIRAKHYFSPDIADSLVLTFAELVPTWEDFEEEDAEDHEETQIPRGCKITGY